MRVVAHIYAYNEEDIVAWTVDHLLKQGVEVIVSDNWSTDATLKVLESFGNDIGLRFWPSGGPVKTVSWRKMLERVEDIALTAAAPGRDGCWFLHHDADEIRRSPVEGENLFDFFQRMSLLGHNAVDHELRNYGPREGWDTLLTRGKTPEEFFTNRRDSAFDQRIGQVKAWWQKPGAGVDLAGSGGHRVDFPGIRVSPERLIMNHYPFRTEAQRIRKLARMSRWSPEERAAGWHVQYEGKQ